jgi:hypothetical protein
MESFLHVLSDTIIATFAVITIVSFFAIFFILIPTWHDSNNQNLARGKN